LGFFFLRNLVSLDAFAGPENGGAQVKLLVLVFLSTHVDGFDLVTPYPNCWHWRWRQRTVRRSAGQGLNPPRTPTPGIADIADIAVVIATVAIAVAVSVAAASVALVIISHDKQPGIGRIRGSAGRLLGTARLVGPRRGGRD
jgi:hypothetical protein